MSRGFYGNVQPGATITLPWSTNDASGGSITTTLGSIRVYKNDDLTQSTAGVTLSTDFDSVTGLHLITIDTSVDTTFYAMGNMYHVVLTGATIDSQTSLNHAIGSFAIGEMVGVSDTAQDNADNVAIANRALTLMGESSITNLGDDNKRAKAANIMLVPVRDSVLEAHTWKTARKLATLVQDTTYAISAATHSADVVTLTVTGHSIAVGTSVVVAGLAPDALNGTFTVVTAPANTITYALTGSNTVTDAIGTILDAVTPNWRYTKQFSLPSDFIRLVLIEQSTTDFELHIDKFMTTQGTVKVEYVFKQTDVSAMGPTLKEAFATKLAYEMTLRLDTSNTKRDLLRKDYETVLAAARNIDASQRPDDIMQSDNLLQGRLGGDDIYRRIEPVS